MAIGTFDELKAAIAGWLNRQDLAGRVEEFIALAEADLNERLRHQKMIIRKTAVLDDTRYPLPCDWLEAHTITRAGPPDAPLRLLPTEALIALRQTHQNETLPTAYSIWGGNIEVGPAHGGASLEMDYYAAIPALTADAPTNWLLTRRPDAYLYGALIHSAPFLIEDDRLQIWLGMYEKALMAMNAADDASRFTGAALVRRPRGFGSFAR